MTLPLFVAAALVLFDLQNLLSRWRGRVLNPAITPTADFTVLVPLYGHPRHFEGRHRILHLQPRTTVVVEATPPVMAAFADQLEAEGWRVHRLHEPNPTPPRLILAALHAGVAATTYVVRLDADTVAAPGDIPRAVAAAANDGADLCSVKVLANQPRTVPAKLQNVEYGMAMLSRHFRAWLTSGACMIARTTALTAILERHTLNYVSEDVETGRIAHSLRMRIRHVDIEILTDVPEGWRALYRQRRLWWAGNFRHIVINADLNAIHMPVWTLYYIGLVWASVYAKAAGLFNPAVLARLPLILLLYTAIGYTANWQVRSRWMLLIAPYALVQTVLMPPIGLVWYIRTARRQHTLGRYRIPHRRTRLAQESPVPT